MYKNAPIQGLLGMHPQNADVLRLLQARRREMMRQARFETESIAQAEKHDYEVRPLLTVKITIK